MASNSDAVITFFATVEDDALARTMLWVTPCENDSESLPLFSLLYATLGDDDSEEEDFGTTLMTTMTMLSLFYFVDDLDIRQKCFGVSTLAYIMTANSQHFEVGRFLSSL